ncbi:hypothetical protein C0J52_28222, partial [Blattella germanica]
SYNTELKRSTRQNKQLTILSTAAARVENTKILTLSFPALLLHKLNYTYHFSPYCSIN